ncbi:hypothetical protein [Amycolatopsis vastitatis]|uniref:hypothetical protein n=1 Tax=Amycolatopsis vastitatis TaxID=1905142 RepID=UPI0013042FEE|nr:hypothetical protein [Amycolatopsis vastitatis]
MGTNESEERPGFLRHIRNWFSWKRPSKSDAVGPNTAVSTTPDRELSERRTSEKPLEVPALGDVFSFMVDHEFVWTARGLSQDTLADRVNTYTDSATRSLFNAIWPIGRTISPSRPEEAEAAINKNLRTWCYEDGQVSCTATVYVHADQRVRDKQLPLWERYVEMELRERLELRRIEQIRTLLTEWCQLIEQFEATPAVVQASRLVDAPFAEVQRDLSQERTERSLDLIGLLRTARDAHAHLGLYEFAISYDNALRSFQKESGLTALANNGDVNGSQS